MIRIVLVFACLFLLASCDSRPKGVLSQEDMTNIITDLHQLDGSLAAKSISSGQFNEKSKYYNSVLKKYRITQAQFDSSVVWYTKNPKKYERIYENVFIQLTALDEDIRKGKYHSVDSTELKKLKINLWSKRFRYELTKDSARTRLHFNVTNKSLLFGDVYILKFKHFIAPRDSSKNPHVVFRIHYANGKVDSVFTKTYNDSLTRRYTIRLSALKKLRIKSLSGELLGSSVYKGTFKATIDSISLVRVYDPKLQDSLRRVVQKANRKKPPTSSKLKSDSTFGAKSSSKKPADITLKEQK